MGPETLLKGNMVSGELVNLISRIQNSVACPWLGLSLGFKVKGLISEAQSFPQMFLTVSVLNQAFGLQMTQIEQQVTNSGQEMETNMKQVSQLQHSVQELNIELQTQLTTVGSPAPDSLPGQGTGKTFRRGKEWNIPLEFFFCFLEISPGEGFGRHKEPLLWPAAADSGTDQ